MIAVTPLKRNPMEMPDELAELDVTGMLEEVCRVEA